MKTNPLHLGDGAYVHHDGHHVVLTANHHDPNLATDRVYIDPRALENLFEWLANHFNVTITVKEKPDETAQPGMD